MKNLKGLQVGKLLDQKEMKNIRGGVQQQYCHTDGTNSTCPSGTVCNGTNIGGFWTSGVCVPYNG